MEEKHHLDTLVGKMKELKEKGYNKDFKLKNGKLESYDGEAIINKEDLDIDNTYRFEGESNPSDSSILYAIKSKSSGVKGLISDSYGASSNNELDDFIKEASG